MSHHAHEPSLANTIRHILRKPKTTLALLGMPGIALAGPTGEVVVGGEAVITRPNAVTTHIDQITQRAAINWWTFDVAADEYVIFDQPDASSIVLNRVIGGDPSQIFGQILANGQVFLLNPQGVFFAPGATVDVQGLLASSLDMNPNDFMAGDFSLTRAENASANGNVINNGSITAGSGGYVLLAGDFVDNTGIISANAGTIALVSGNALTLDIEGDGLVNFAVNEATLSDIAGVRNAGSLIADGGRIIMTAQVANNLMSTVVNNEGLVRAQSIEEHGGEIYLVGYGGNVVNSGTLDADGVNADGGRIIVYGDQDVTLADGGVQTAAGDENHEGGLLRFIAEDHLDYQADNLIRATGGPDSERGGGFVEVSGHGSIAIRGTPDIGAGGTFYIDPSSITIVDGTSPPVSSVGSVADGYIESQLQLGVNVVLAASNVVTANTGTSITDSIGGGNLTIGIGSMTAGAGGTCLGLNSSLCQGPSPGFTPQLGGSVNVTSLALNINGDLLISAQSGTVNMTNATAGNITIDATSGSVNFNNLNAPGTITLNGQSVSGNNIGASTAVAGSLIVNVSGGAGNFALSNSAYVSGLAQIITSGGSIGNINIGGIVEAGAVNFHANGLTGDLAIGSYASAGSAINLSATATGGNGGNITIGTGLQAGGNIDVTADGGSGSGGNINVSSGGMSATSGAVTLTATGGTFAGGNITVVGAGPKGIAGANGITISATGVGAASVSDNAVITISGQVQGQNGNVTITASNTNTGIGGNIFIAGNGSAGQIRGQNIFISATGSGSNAGRIELGNGVAESTFQAAALTAFTGNINLFASGNDGVVVAGNMNAPGNINITATGGGQGHVHIGDYLSGILSPGAIAAGGKLNVFASGSVAQFDAGSITADGGIDIQALSSIAGQGNVDIGALSVNNASAPGVVFIDATGNILVTGGISVTGRANSGNPQAAAVDLHTSASSGSITVTGPIDVNATAASYNVSGSLEGGDSGSFNSSGAMGFGVVRVATFGAANLGNISVDAVGQGLVEISAKDVTTGNITVNVADGNFTRVSNLSICDSMTCSITRTETLTNGGNADVRFNSNSTPGGSLDFGTVNITAGSAHFDAGGFLTISGGGITINASGNDFEIASNGTFGATAIDYLETHNGGGATVNLMTGSSGAIALSGAVDLSAPGNASFRATADTISLMGITAAASAGTFTRSGSPAGDQNDGPFNDEGANRGGPRIDEGTFTGGGVTVSLGGYVPSPSSGTVNATDVTITGNINLSGAGNAELSIHGNAVTVTGSTILTSTTMTRNGTYADSYFDSVSDFIQESGSVSGSWGNVDLDVSGSGDMQLGDITLSGPMVGGRVEGVNVTVGAVNVTATGGTLSVQETSSVNSASTKEFSFSGPNLITGIGLRADNALNITGDITLNAVGAGGMLLFGTTIATQDITISVTNGNYTVTDARFFSPPATNFTVGDAVLGFAGATATVNGNLTLNAAGNVNYGGVANVAGNFVVNANGSLTPVISDQVQYLNAVDSEDSDAAIVLPGAFNIQATNITLTATTGSLDIRNTQLNANQVMSLTAGTNLLMEAATLNAGAMELDVGGAVNDGDGLLASLVAVAPITTAITANSLTVVAGGAIDLDNTAMNIGSGAALGVTGDAELLALLTTHGIAPASTTPNAYFAGTNVSLGELTLGGDYLFVAAETFAMASFTGSHPDTLVQLTALSPTASIGIEDTVPNSSTVNFLNNDTFSQFAGMTIAVGDSQLAGNINIGENGDIDVGSTNFFVVTDGVIIGMDKILSTGIIGNLGVLLSNVFDVPQSNEIDFTLDTFDELSDDYALEEDEDEGEQEGEDTDDESGSEGDDESLIRQDTVDEELVCS